MKRSIVFLFLFFLFSTNVLAQFYGPTFQIYPDSPRYIYLLPGEPIFLQFGVKPYGDTWIADKKMKVLQATWSHRQLLENFDGFCSWWQISASPWDELYKIYDGTVYFNWSYGLHRYTWVADSVSVGLDFLWLFYFSATNNMAVGDSCQHFLNVVVVNEDTTEHNMFKMNILKCIDGVRGDVDGSGTVDEEDVRTLAVYDIEYREGNFTTRYTNGGINLGRGAILFGHPCLFDIYLLNLYVKNSENPLLEKWGIGRLMSGRNNSLLAVPFDSSSSGNILSIVSEGNMCQVSAIFSDNVLVETKMDNNGNFIFEFPEKPLRYVVESVNLDGVTTTDVENFSGEKIAKPQSFQLDQNYPNPFNPETQISYSLAKAGHVKLAVYNVLGQKVADLVDEFKAANNYKMNFDASNLTSGIYFYRLEVDGLSKTMKMVLSQ